MDLNSQDILYEQWNCEMPGVAGRIPHDSVFEELQISKKNFGEKCIESGEGNERNIKCLSELFKMKLILHNHKKMFMLKIFFANHNHFQNSQISLEIMKD